MVESNKKTSSQTHVQCPSCGYDMNVEQMIERHAEARLRTEFNRKYVQLRKQVKEQEDALERERLEVKQLSAKTWEIIQAELKKERIRLANQLKQEAIEEAKSTYGSIEEQLKEKQQEILQMKRREVEILNKERSMELQKEQVKLEMEQDFLRRQSEIERTVRTQLETRQDLLKHEYEKKLADQKKLIDEMTRKMEQGSMQMQGEVQEQIIEQFLMQSFPQDEISSVKTGAHGADCLQVVCNRKGLPAGSIYYESKRTKAFQMNWIDKLKQDMRDRKADIGVIVTQTMPKDMNRMGEVSGIWVCTFEEFKALSAILRENLIRISEVAAFQKQSGDKMSLLYDFLTSNEFKMQVEGIVDGFTQLHEELMKEKRAMQAIWKRREKQIEKVLLNTNHMYGSIRGIAGSAVQPIDALELPEGS